MENSQLESAINGINEKAAQINENAVEVKAAKEKTEALEVELKSAKDEVVKLGSEVAKMKEADVAKKQSNLSTAEELKQKMEDIKAVAKGVSAAEILVKANTVRASISGNTESFRLPEIERLAHRKLSMYDIFPKIPVDGTNNNGVITYTDWDEATTVRAAAMIAEGGTFPESTATFIEKNIAIKKVGDTLPVSAEFYEDEARFAAELELFLQTNIELEIDQQIYNGDGTGNNLTGITQTATPFNATGLTTVANATFYDLLAIAPEMLIGYGSKYMFDAVLMNKKMINKLHLTKDADNNYIIPPFTTLNGMNVSGMVVIEANVMADNEAILADRRYGAIYERTGVTMERGLVGTQFVQDLETLKVRKRLAFLIKESNARGFIYISDVDAAITAITAV